jgi:hypothetical protein
MEERKTDRRMKKRVPSSRKRWSGEENHANVARIRPMAS